MSSEGRESVHSSEEGEGKKKAVTVLKDPPFIPGRRIMRDLEGEEESNWRKFKMMARKRENYGDFAGWIEEVEADLKEGKAIKKGGPWDLSEHYVRHADLEEGEAAQKKLAQAEEEAEEQKEQEELRLAGLAAAEEERRVLQEIRFSATAAASKFDPFLAVLPLTHTRACDGCPFMGGDLCVF